MSSGLGDACPTEGKLVKFLEGRLSYAELDVVVEHVEGCAACGERIERLESDSQGLSLPIDIGIPDAAEMLDAQSDVIRRAIALNDVQKTASTSQETSHELRDGQKLGDYRIIREVGRGGMGIVYEAEQESLGRRVALKVLPDHVSATQQLRFSNEAKAAARLHHTNIVPVFGVGHHAGTSFYAMQFIDGVSLDTVLKKLQASPADSNELIAGAADADQSSGTSSHHLSNSSKSDSTSGSSGSDSIRSRRDIGNYWKSVARIGQQVALALQYAHHEQIVHRDIKPSNLLLDDRGNVWVADFGLAKSEAMDNLTQSGDILGTVRYMPPEAFEGVSGTAGDVYSLGITLYELTTLRSAYESEDKRQLIKLVASEPPTPIHRSREGVPADLATIVHKAIEREPAHRYRSAGDLAEDLRRFLSDEPILARRIPYLERLRRWSRRNKQLAASMIGIACLLVLIAIGSAGSSIYFRQQEEKSNILAAGNQRLLEENRVALRKAVDLAARLEKARQAAVEQEETTQRNLYYSHMSNANQAIGGHRGLGRTLALLNQWRPKKGMADLRGWEWYYINGRCYQEEFSLAAHQDDIRGVCRSPDDRFVASVGLDGTLVIWDVESRKLVRQIRDEFQEGYCVAWNAAGNRLAVGSNAGLIVWDSSTWEVARRIHETRKVLGVTWGPNGRLLAAAMEKTPDAPALITLIETEGWETYASMTTRTLGLYNVSVSFNSDGDLFAYADFKNAVIWDVQEKRELRRLIGHTGTIQATQFHPQRNEILASGSRDAKILIWNALTGARQGTLNGHTHAVSAVNWHPDGKRLASASWDGTIRIWDVEAAQTRHAYSSHSAHVFSLAWNQRGEQLVSGGDDRLVKSWHAEGAGSEARIVTSADVFVRLSFSPDGCKLAGAAAGGRVYMLDAESMQVLWQEQHGRSTVRRVLFASDTRSFLSVSVDSTVRRWSMEPELISAVKVGVNNVRTADMHPDGEKLAVGGGDGKIEIWNADLSERRQTIETTFPLVNYLRWSPDGQSLAIVGNKREIRLFDMASNHFRIIPVNASEVWTVEWNSSGDKIITTSSDQRIQVWDVDSMSRLMHFDGHFDYIPAVSWCCNGRRILSADARGTVKIWDTELNREQGQELLSLSTPVGELRAACWSPDGKKIAAASRGVITIWDATRGYEIEEKQFGTNASHVQEDDSAP